MEIYRAFPSTLKLSNEVENASYVPYVLVDKLFTPEELALIIDLWDEGQVIDTKVYLPGNARADVPEHRKSRKQYLHTEGNEWIYDKIAGLCLMMNAARFKFEISGFHGPLSYNLYEPDNYFTWHMDYGAKASSRRKLVVCIQLSDSSEYEGGDLQLINDVTVSKEKGSVAIFPSFVVHRVAPVVSGCRKSLVAHIGGPPFR